MDKIKIIIKKFFPCIRESFFHFLDENVDGLSTPNNNIENLNSQSVNHDHHYYVSPSTLHKKLIKSKSILKNKGRIIKLKNRRLQRLQTRIKSLKEAVTDLRRKNMVSENCLSCLDTISDQGVKEFVERAIRNGKKMSKRKYPAALHSFAITLHFYSPRAYNYVREKMNMALPAPSVLRSWYNSIDGEPGFTSESFMSLKYKVEKANIENKKVIVSLIIDEMGLKKGTQRGKDGKVSGHVKFRAEFETDDNLREAKNALVIMVVAIDDNWKLPIAYFLIDGIDSNTSSGLIRSSLIKLHEIGVEVVSLTLDGTSEHLSMVQKLGAKFDIACNVIQPYFLHPVTQNYVYVIYDGCHMLKLIRNVLGDWKRLLDSDNNKIEWKYITSLAYLQETEGLRGGNKLRLNHIRYFKMKMKVNLAVQTLSQSVADTLEFCMNDLKLPQFQGCEVTIRFIRSIDILFDFLNSRNPYGQGYKAPLKRENEHIWWPRIKQILVYISTLKNEEQ